MSSCSNLATKAELSELESEIDILKASLEGLKNEFDSHKKQNIPQAHQYNSNLQVSTSYQEEELTVTVTDASSSGNDSCTIPEFEIKKFTIEQALNGKVLDTTIYLNDYKSNDSTSLETLLAFIPPPGEGLTLAEVLAAVRPLIAAAIEGLKALIEIAREISKSAEEKAEEAFREALSAWALAQLANINARNAIEQAEQAQDRALDAIRSANRYRQDLNEVGIALENQRINNDNFLVTLQSLTNDLARQAINNDNFYNSLFDLDNRTRASETNISNLSFNLDNLKFDLTKYQVDLENYQKSIDNLAIDVDGAIVDLKDLKSFKEDTKYRLTTTYVDLEEVKRSVGGGGGIGILEPRVSNLEQKIDEAEKMFEGITFVDPNEFNLVKQDFENLKQNGSEMDIKNFRDLGDKVDNLDRLLQLTMYPIITQIGQQTTEDSIRNATENAICNSSNGGCLTNNIANPLNNAINNPNWLSGLNAAISGLDFAVVMNKLNAMDTFLRTAWSSTRADKILNLINTALILHNAVMLSNSAYYTITEIIDNVFATFNIKDHEDNDIDVSNWIGNKLQTIITSIIGAEAYENISTTLKKGNRIYQASANVLWGIRDIMDSAQNIAELTGENVSIIGNALRKCGVVRENAYSRMPENINANNAFLNRMENIQEGLDMVEEISQDTRDVKETWDEITENKKEFNDALADWNKDKDKQENNIKKSINNFSEEKESDTEQG